MKTIRISGYFLCILGLLLISVSIGADLIGIGRQTGFGAKQLNLILAGGLILLIGLMIFVPPFQKYIYRWVSPVGQETQSLHFKNKQDQLIKFITIAMWFGLIAGLIEIGYRLIQKYVMHAVLNLGPHFIWLVPTALMLIFLFLGVIFYLSNLLLPRWVTFQVMLFSLNILALMSLYYLKPKFQIISALILAGAISFQLSRIINRRQTLFFELVERTFRWMIVVVISSAAFLIGFNS